MSRKAKTAKTLLHVIPLMLISLVIGIRLYLWNAKNLVGNAMPMPFGCGASVILSGSMEPELSVNDLVFVREQNSYRIGDIVVYQDGSILVIHRIISIDGDEIITQGDANNMADQPIDISAVKGRAVGHIPSIGAFVRFLQTPIGFILMLAAAVALFELPYIKERKRSADEIEKIKEEILKLKNENNTE